MCAHTLYTVRMPVAVNDVHMKSGTGPFDEL